MPAAPLESSQSPCCSRISFNPRKTMGLASGFAASGLATRGPASVSERAPARAPARVLASSFTSVIDGFACSAAASMFQPQDCRHGIQTAAGVRGRIIYGRLQTEPHPLKLISKSNYFALADRSGHLSGSTISVQLIRVYRDTRTQRFLLEIRNLGAEFGKSHGPHYA